MFQYAAGYSDLSESTPAGTSWHSVRTAMNRARRAAHRIGQYDRPLYAAATSVVQSLEAELEVIREAGTAGARGRRAEWERIRTRSDALRVKFNDLVDDRT